jgi:long-chain acyl-CoA synthetase
VALVGNAIYLVGRLLMRALFRLRVEGRDRLPVDGPFVLAANHASDLDPLVVAAALPWRSLRRVHWGGDAGRLFGDRRLHGLWRALRVFPVDEHAPAASLAVAAAVLKRGNGLVWFPESWRSPTGDLQPFRPGIGVLLEQVDAPVVPAWIEGAFEAMPRDRRLPRLRPIRVVIGQPVRAEALAAAGEGAARAARIVDGLRRRVAALRPPVR